MFINGCSTPPRFRAVYPIQEVVDMQGAEFPFVEGNGHYAGEEYAIQQALPSWRNPLIQCLKEHHVIDPHVRLCQESLAAFDEDYRNDSQGPYATVLSKKNDPVFKLVTGPQARLLDQLDSEGETTAYEQLEAQLLAEELKNKPIRVTVGKSTAGDVFIKRIELA